MLREECGDATGSESVGWASARAAWSRRRPARADARLTKFSHNHTVRSLDTRHASPFVIDFST